MPTNPDQVPLDYEATPPEWINPNNLNIMKAATPSGLFGASMMDEFKSMEKWMKTAEEKEVTDKLSNLLVSEFGKDGVTKRTNKSRYDELDRMYRRLDDTYRIQRETLTSYKQAYEKETAKVYELSQDLAKLKITCADSEKMIKRIKAISKDIGIPLQTKSPKGINLAMEQVLDKFFGTILTLIRVNEPDEVAE